MLPQTPLRDPPQPHEPINDLPVHTATIQQLFHPVAESRHFTRADAGEAFEKGLLPADQRIQHPELVSIGRARPEVGNSDEWVKAEAEDAAQRAAVRARKQKRFDATSTIHSGRWDFRFQDVKVGKENTARGVLGIGFRYGVPPQDRKKGQVKIPTRAV